MTGGPGNNSFNTPVAFDDAGDGFWLITNQGGEFQQLAWQPRTAGSEPEFITAGIPWDVSEAVMSHDRKRLASRGSIYSTRRRVKTGRST